MGLNVSNTFDKSGTLKTVLPREGVDIGKPADFWGDMRQILARIPRKPVTYASAADQGGALRAAAPVSSGPDPRDLALAAQMHAPHPTDYSTWTPSNFGHPSMSAQGVMGTFVNPMDVPLGLQGKVPTGFYTDNTASNYSYSPLVDPRRYGQPAGGKS